MSSMLYLLSLCVVAVIQLTSSQSTWDIEQQQNDVSSCGRTEQAVNQLMRMNAQLMKTVSQLQRDVSAGCRLRNDVRGTYRTLIQCPYLLST